MPWFRNWFVLIFFFAPSISNAAELKTLAGKSVTGTLKSIDADSVVMETDAGPVSTPLSQVLMLDFQPFRTNQVVRHHEVRLIDDSVLYAADVVYSAKEIELKLISGTELKLPLSSIVSILKDAQDSAVRKQFHSLLKAKVRSDRILIYRDGELNAVEGALGDIDAEGKAIEFKREGAAAIKARFELLQGFTFLRTDVAKDTAVCKVIVQDGDTFIAARVTYEGDTLTLVSPFGTKIPLKGEILARLDFNLGRLTFLSDLEPSKLSESAFFGGFPAFRKDLNQDGRPIVLLDKTFTKGVTLEGGVAVEYNLNGKYKDFKAFVGADIRTAEGALGKTTVVVYCDGEKKHTEVVSATELRPIAVSVKDVGTLRIVVEGSNFTGLSSYVTLAEARVSQ